MWWKEFQARFESDAEFRAKFADVKTEDEFIARAKAEGYDFEQLSEDELDDVAGGMPALAPDDNPDKTAKKFFDWLGDELKKIVGA